MDNFNFSDNTVTIRDWYAFNHAGENDDIQAKILVLSADSSAQMLAGPLHRLDRIIVTSVDFNDGRIFSLARQIRLLGYNGILTVVGDVMLDQFSALLSCGFDTVLILDNFTPCETIELGQALNLARVEEFVANHP